MPTHFVNTLPLTERVPVGVYAPTMDEDNDNQPVKYGLPDCTEDAGVPAETMPTLGGLAITQFGKPFGDLERWQQNMIRSVIDGNRRELEETIKSLRTNNMLTAEVKKARMHAEDERVDTMYECILKDVEHLVIEGDDMDAKLWDIQKNKSGSVRAKLRTLSSVERLNALRLKNKKMLMELGEQDEQPRVVNFNQDNRKIAVSPEAAGERLSKFGGKTVDQSGDGSVSGQGADD